MILLKKTVKKYSPLKARVKKKIRNQKWQPRNGCSGRLMEIFFNNDNSDEFVCPPPRIDISN